MFSTISPFVKNVHPLLVAMLGILNRTSVLVALPEMEAVPAHGLGGCALY